MPLNRTALPYVPSQLAVVTATGTTPYRLVPVRFARAVAGFSDANAPDLDDHGFTIPPQYATAHGPVTGVMKDSTIRVKIIRDRLAPSSQLFVTSADDAIAAIDFPPKDTALSPDDTPADKDAKTPARLADSIYIRGASNSKTSVETILSVRFGSSTGPILAQLCVRVYPVLTIDVQVHDVSINGEPSNIAIEDAQELFALVNKIYAQAGVQFHVLPTLRSESVAGFSHTGRVFLPDDDDAHNKELQTILNINPLETALNAYFINGYIAPDLQNKFIVMGIAFSRDSASANPPETPPRGSALSPDAPVASRPFPGTQAGIVCWLHSDTAMVAHNVAHEIGHALTLQHYNNSHQEHLWSHRCLMHWVMDIDNSDLPVGYGNYADGSTSAGELLMTKSRPNIRQSDQINTLRKALLNDSFKPLKRK